MKKIVCYTKFNDAFEGLLIKKTKKKVKLQTNLGELTLLRKDIYALLLVEGAWPDMHASKELSIPDKRPEYNIPVQHVSKPRTETPLEAATRRAQELKEEQLREGNYQEPSQFDPGLPSNVIQNWTFKEEDL